MLRNESIDEQEQNEGRVTRSLRKRLGSVERDSPAMQKSVVVLDTLSENEIITRSLRKRAGSVERDIPGTPKKNITKKLNILDTLSETGQDIDLEQSDKSSTPTLRSNRKSVNGNLNSSANALKSHSSKTEITDDESVSSENHLLRNTRTRSMSKSSLTEENITAHNTQTPGKRVTRRNSLTTESLTSDVLPGTPKRITRQSLMQTADLATVNEDQEVQSPKIVAFEESPTSEKQTQKKYAKTPRANKSQSSISLNESIIDKNETDKTEKASLGSPIQDEYGVTTRSSTKNQTLTTSAAVNSGNSMDSHISINSNNANIESAVKEPLQPVKETATKEIEISPAVENEEKDKEEEPDDNKNNFKFSHSWSQSVTANCNSPSKKVIDAFGVAAEKSPEQEILSPRSSNKSLNSSKKSLQLNESVKSSGKEKELEPDSENDGNDVQKKSEFIDDEVIEVEDGEESMDEEERQYIKDNEIPDDGISIGSEDTEEEEDLDDDDDDKNNSFVIDDDLVEDDLLDGTGDDLDFNDSENEDNKQGKRKKKGVLQLSDNEVVAEVNGSREIENVDEEIQSDDDTRNIASNYEKILEDLNKTHDTNTKEGNSDFEDGINNSTTSQNRIKSPVLTPNKDSKNISKMTRYDDESQTQFNDNSTSEEEEDKNSGTSEEDQDVIDAKFSSDEEEMQTKKSVTPKSASKHNKTSEITEKVRTPVSKSESTDKNKTPKSVNKNKPLFIEESNSESEFENNTSTKIAKTPKSGQHEVERTPKRTPKSASKSETIEKNKTPKSGKKNKSISIVFDSDSEKSHDSVILTKLTPKSKSIEKNETPKSDKKNKELFVIQTDSESDEQDVIPKKTPNSAKIGKKSPQSGKISSSKKSSSAKTNVKDFGSESEDYDAEFILPERLTPNSSPKINLGIESSSNSDENSKEGNEGDSEGQQKNKLSLDIEKLISEKEILNEYEDSLGSEDSELQKDKNSAKKSPSASKSETVQDIDSDDNAEEIVNVDSKNGDNDNDDDWEDLSDGNDVKKKPSLTDIMAKCESIIKSKNEEKERLKQANEQRKIKKQLKKEQKKKLQEAKEMEMAAKAKAMEKLTIKKNKEKPTNIELPEQERKIEDISAKKDKHKKMKISSEQELTLTSVSVNKKKKHNLPEIKSTDSEDKQKKSKKIKEITNTETKRLPQSILDSLEDVPIKKSNKLEKNMRKIEKIVGKTAEVKNNNEQKRKAFCLDDGEDTEMDALKSKKKKKKQNIEEVVHQPAKIIDNSQKIQKNKKKNLLNILETPVSNFKIDPITPEAKSNEFKVSPITPKSTNDFNILAMLKKPKEQYKKVKKTKQIKEPITVLPKPMWTTAGMFVVSKEVKLCLGSDGVPTDFTVTSLEPPKKKFKKAKAGVPVSAATSATTNSAYENPALNFKQQSLYRTGIIRENMKKSLQRNEKQKINKKFSQF